MKNISHPIALIFFAASMLPCLPAFALPKEPDCPFYIRTARGQVVDLGSMRRSSGAISPTIPVVPSRGYTSEGDSPFISNYKKRVLTVENVAAARYLTQQADQIPEKLSKLGASVCRGVNVKLSRPEIVSIIEKGLPNDSQNTLMHYAGLQRINILIDMAEAGECP